MAIQLPAKFLMHQLACPGALQFTALHLRNALAWGKGAGFKGMIVVPKAWHPDLTAKIAVEIAGELGMKLQTCGFLPGDQYKPHTVEGSKIALEELRRQAEHQVLFNRLNCGGNVVCGPIDIGWRGKNDLAGYSPWLLQIDILSTEMGIRFAVESLNSFESDLENPFQLLAETLDDINAQSTFIHFDTGHADNRLVPIEFFEKNAHRILVMELVNRGREPLSKPDLVDLEPYYSRVHLLNPDCQLSIEPFDATEVSGPLGLIEAGVITSTLSGYDSMWQDRKHLIANRVMLVHL